MPIQINSADTEEQRKSFLTLNRRIEHQLGRMASRDAQARALLQSSLKTGFYNGVEVPSILVDDLSKPAKKFKDNRGNDYWVQPTKPYTINPNEPLPNRLKGMLLSRLGNAAAQELGSDYEDPLTQQRRKRGVGPFIPLDTIIDLRQKARQLFYRNASVPQMDLAENIAKNQQLPNTFGLLQRINELMLDKSYTETNRVQVKDKKTGLPVVGTDGNPVYIHTAKYTPQGQLGFNAIRQFNQYLHSLGHKGNHTVVQAVDNMAKDVRKQIDNLHQRDAHIVEVPQEEPKGKLLPYFTRLQQYTQSGNAVLQAPLGGFAKFKPDWSRQPKLRQAKQSAIITPSTGATYAKPEEVNNTSKAFNHPVSTNAIQSAMDTALQYLTYFETQPNSGKKGFGQQNGLAGIDHMKKHIATSQSQTIKNGVSSPEQVLHRLVVSMKGGKATLHYTDENTPYVNLHPEAVDVNSLKKTMKMAMTETGIKLDRGKVDKYNRQNPYIGTFLTETAKDAYAPLILKQAGMLDKLPKTLADGSLDLDDDYTLNLLQAAIDSTDKTKKLDIKFSK